MNWGNSIVVVFVLFATFIGYMVIKAFQENFDLVAEDYYAQEINYQSKLVKLANTESSDKVVVIKQETEKLVLTFPNHQAEGTIQFYHPSREIFDKTFQITLKNGSQIIDKEDLVPGNYRININWKEGDTEFLQESNVFIR
ncbi:MAG: FixH family protein [Bacteroidota bacterium]